MTEDPPLPVLLMTVPGSRLEELQAGYDAARAQFEDAKSRFESLTAALKAEMAAAAPHGATEVTLPARPGLPALRIKWMRPWRFDVKRFRAEQPGLYVRYEVQGGHWEIRPGT